MKKKKSRWKRLDDWLDQKDLIIGTYVIYGVAIGFALIIFDCIKYNL